MQETGVVGRSVLPVYSGRRSLRSSAGRACLIRAEWQVLEPEEGRFDMEAVEALKTDIIHILSMGYEPVLSLHSGTEPEWFHRRGGWMQEDNLRCYLRYAGRTVRLLGHLVREYITFEIPELAAGRKVNTELSNKACTHIRACRLIADTRRAWSAEDTIVGFGLALRSGSRRRFGRGAAEMMLEWILFRAMARGTVTFPLKNTLRVRPGIWYDFLLLSGGDPGDIETIAALAEHDGKPIYIREDKNDSK